MRPIFAGLVAFVLLGSAAALADTSRDMDRDAGRSLPAAVDSVRLLPGWIRADGARQAAVEIRLAPGWHTYWRNPGSSGVPPEFDWSGSVNLASVAYEWPRPQVFAGSGAPTIGYEDRLTLPILLTPDAAGRPIDARLDLFFGVCKDICIPAEIRLEARLDPSAPAQDRTGAKRTGEERAEIERALADRPLDAAAFGVSARCALAAAAEGPAITAEITGASSRFGAAATTVIEADARTGFWIGPAATRQEGDRLLATAPFDASGAAVLDRAALRLTLLEDDRALDIRGCAGG